MSAPGDNGREPRHERVSFAHYPLILLVGVYALNFIDRQILVILQEPIKAEMGLSDAQLGLLTGFAFAVFYVTAGIPIAYWADRSNRRNIVAWAIIVWSAMTAVTGLVQNYVQMMLARIGVGIGEAGSAPPSHSMIADYFPPQQRGTALSIYTLGLYLGILAGFLLGGWLESVFGWRGAFFAVGLPGLLIGVLVRFTIPEPVRGRFDESAPVEAGSPRETLSTLFGLPSFVLLSLAASMAAFTNWGILNFMPSFLIRSHGLSIPQASVILALTVALGGATGSMLGGWLSDSLGQKERRWYLWLGGISQLLAVPAIAFCLHTGSLAALSVAYFFVMVFGYIYFGPTIATALGLVPPRMRAVTSAILFFILNMIGLGGGPVTIGLISDYLAPALGAESLRWALTTLTASALLAGCLFLLAARRLPADWGRFNRESAPPA